MTTIKTVWITGASSGLGLATAKAFAGRGWLVVAGARSFADGTVHEEEKAEHWVRLRLDVTDGESCAHFVRRALEISPRVDALVCGAAVLVLGSCEKTGADEYNRVLDTNFTGAARMVSLALPYMRAQGSGRIVLFSSINGLLGIPFQSAYTASKHALEGYAECLAMETAPWGVQVCLVEPGDHRGCGRHPQRRGERAFPGPAGRETGPKCGAQAYALPPARGQAGSASGGVAARAAASVAEWTGAVRLLSGKKEGVRRVKKENGMRSRSLFSHLERTGEMWYDVG